MIIIYACNWSKSLMHIVFAHKSRKNLHNSTIAIVTSFCKYPRTPIGRNRWSKTWESWVFNPHILHLSHSHNKIYLIQIHQEILLISRTYKTQPFHESLVYTQHVALQTWTLHVANVNLSISLNIINLIVHWSCLLFFHQYLTCLSSCHKHFFSICITSNLCLNNNHDQYGSWKKMFFFIQFRSRFLFLFSLWMFAQHGKIYYA